MKISVVRIGNSKGIRLNKMLLDKYQIHDEVDLIMEEEFILIKPVSKSRKGWDDAFSKMKAKGDDQPIIESIPDDEAWDD
jgi:antitoxin MazE